VIFQTVLRIMFPVVYDVASPL